MFFCKLNDAYIWHFTTKMSLKMAYIASCDMAYGKCLWHVNTHNEAMTMTSSTFKFCHDKLHFLLSQVQIAILIVLDETSLILFCLVENWALAANHVWARIVCLGWRSPWIWSIAQNGNLFGYFWNCKERLLFQVLWASCKRTSCLWGSKSHKNHCQFSIQVHWGDVYLWFKT